MVHVPYKAIHALFCFIRWSIKIFKNVTVTNRPTGTGAVILLSGYYQLLPAVTGLPDKTGPITLSRYALISQIGQWKQ